MDQLERFLTFAEQSPTAFHAAANLAEQLREKGVPAECIGRLTRGLDKVITDKTETEYLNRPEPDELLKVLPEMKIPKPY